MRSASSGSARVPAQCGRGFAVIRCLHGPEPERRARRIVIEVLGAGIAETVDDVQLAICEMVTNARKHAPPPYELRIFICATAVKIAVADGGTDYDVLATQLAQTAAAGVPSLEESGRGLQLITALFPGACGVEPALARPGRLGAKQVWISTPLTARCVPLPASVPTL